MFKKKEKYEVMDFVNIEITCEAMKNLIDMTRILNDQEDGARFVKVNLDALQTQIEALQKYNLELKKRLD